MDSYFFMRDIANRHGGYSNENLTSNVENIKEINKELAKYDEANHYYSLRFLYNDFILKLKYTMDNKYLGYGRVFLLMHDFISIFRAFSLMFGNYIGNSKVKDNFPLFFQTLSRFYKNDEFGSMSIDKIYNIFDPYFDFSMIDNNTNSNSDVILPRHLVGYNDKKYIEYNKNMTSMYEADNDLISIAAEKNAFDIEVNEFNNPFWVANIYGDGFGFDVYSMDKNTNFEKIIEVKTSASLSFNFTANEFNVLKNMEKYKGDYFVYFYYIPIVNSKLYYDLYIFKYDYENNNFYRVNDVNKPQDINVRITDGNTITNKLIDKGNIMRLTRTK